MAPLTSTTTLMRVNEPGSGLSEPLRRLFDPRVMCRHLWHYRDQIRQFTVREVRAGHKGTGLGLMWLAITPLTRLAIFSLVFGELLQIRFRDQGGGYAFYLFVGLIVFGLFGDTVTKCAHLIRSRPQFVKKLVFPVEILPVSVLGAGFVVAVLEMVLLVLAKLVFFREVSPYLLLLPVVLIPTMMLGLGVGWIVASLGVFLSDMRDMTRLIVQNFLFFLTPIIYPLSMVQGLPERVAWAGYVIEYNPFTILVESARAVALDGKPPDWIPLLVVTAIGFALLQFGYFFFMKSRRAFADVI